MPFLVDELIPDINNVFFHQDIYEKLKRMSSDNSIPHIILHGPPGAGKKTMIGIFLRMIYGDTITRLYTSSYNIAGSGNKTKKETVQNSNHHIIINPTGTNFDRYLVHEIVKRYAGSKTIELTQNPNSRFKTIQISNLDKLSHSAQTSLRRMIEVNASTCRFIMWCDNLNNIIGPLKSRCVCIRLPRPQKREIFSYLVYISAKKNMQINLKKIIQIVDYSECDIKKAIWCMQYHALGYDYLTNYDHAIKNIVRLIVECNFKKIEEIRDIFFNIWITNYEGIQIISDILKKIIREPMISEVSKLNIVIRTAEIEYNMRRGRRDIIHFDTFVTAVMHFILQQSSD